MFLRLSRTSKILCIDFAFLNSLITFNGIYVDSLGFSMYVVLL